MKANVGMTAFRAVRLFFIPTTAVKIFALDTIKQMPVSASLIKGIILTVIIEKEATS